MTTSIPPNLPSTNYPDHPGYSTEPRLPIRSCSHVQTIAAQWNSSPHFQNDLLKLPYGYIIETGTH